MREIKFRAWNTRLQEMEYIDDLYWFEENFCHQNGDNDYVIMQYTGLQDAKGNKVYEGDIVEITRDKINPGGVNPNQTYTKRYLVKWDDQCTGFSPFGHSYWYENTANKIKVIGNKYQHGELLNEQKTANIGTD